MSLVIDQISSEADFRPEAAKAGPPPFGLAVGSELVDILVIDDQPEVLAVLKRQMTRKGYSVRTAEDAVEAAAQLEICRPRVILLDLMMPLIDGAAFLTDLRKEHSPGALPVIIVTASDQRVDMLRCLDAGANDFMTKPVDLDALTARVEVQIAIANRFRALEQGAALAVEAPDCAREAVWSWRPHTGEFLTSATFEPVCGVSAATFEDWIAGLRPAAAEEFVEQIRKLRARHIRRIEMNLLCGEPGDRALLVRAGREGEGRDERITGAVVDVTEPFLRDAASQLPAEGAFVDRLAARHAQGAPANVILLDVGRFDELTMAHGIVRADEAMQVYIATLQRAVSPAGELFRLGATEFAIIMSSSSGSGRSLAVEIASGDAFGVHIGSGQIHRIAAAVGLALDCAETPAETRFRAKLALKAATEAGEGSVREYSEELREDRLRQARVESRLSVALATDAIDVVFNPLADASTSRWRGIEACPRWFDETLGAVPWQELEASAELIGRAFDLLEVVARKAFRVAAAINSGAEKPLFVAVRVPGSCAKDPSLPTLITSLARETLLDLSSIVLEVREDDILGDYEVCAKVFRALNKIGVRVAIDNFGSSYSTLTYLCRVPSQILKVDEAMLEAAEEREDARTLLGTTSRMAKHLGKTVILSGVMEGTQMRVAREVGADMVQGAHMSRPLDADDVVTLVQAFR